MQKWILALLFLLLALFSGRLPGDTAVAAGAATSSATSPTYSADFLVTGEIPGAVRQHALNVFGPNSCTAHGDPFSPLNSTWDPGSYTYRFLIEIPPNYADDTIRVELLDPDSINQPENEADVSYSDTAVAAGFPATPEPLTCSGSQRDPCAIETELSLHTNQAIPLSRLNPLWQVRMDANRGAGTAPGDGTCGSPASYNPAYNTRTLFQLYYHRQAAGGSLERVDLASYTGQVGDGIYDSGEHDTDLRWVSPGSAPRSDQSAFVPIDAGSATSFTLDLSTDTPGLYADPGNGRRYLLLDVTTLRGASANNFHIWAGPEAANAHLPSDVNQRNLYLVNNPAEAVHNSLPVYAQENWPLTEYLSIRNTRKQIYLSPDFAGKDAIIRVFDDDSGSMPPLQYTIDTLIAGDWQQSFNFLSGNNDWEAYTLTLPASLAQCDYLNPTPSACTPFYGGWLTLSADDGQYDNVTWEVHAVTAPTDTTAGCTALFPVAVHTAAASLSAAAYPDAGAFSYPPAPPAYDDFPTNSPDAGLLANRPGTVYRLPLSGSSGGAVFTIWNEGATPGSATLARSLTWPGDSGDYADHGDSGSVPTGSPVGHVVRGYLEPGAAQDQTTPHVDDLLAVSSGTMDDTAVQTQIHALIDNGRIIRLPLYDSFGFDATATPRVNMAGFGLFRVRGYGGSGDDAWLLLELLRLDKGCGQVVYPLYLPLVQAHAPNP